MTPSLFTWHAAGRPAHAYPIEAATCCATCAAAVTQGVALRHIETPTMANHADHFRFGKHVCDGCAWLFGIGKGRPGNYLATPERWELTVISQESVVADKRPWLAVLRELAALPADTPCCGVLTTDVKRRLWPQVRMASVGAFGLYVHAPDWDISGWRSFDLGACLAVAEAIIPALRRGYSKASCYHGLWRDHARAAKDLPLAATLEAGILPHRREPHFVPALLVAGVTQEEKKDVRVGRPAVIAEPAPAKRDPDITSQLKLF